MDAESLKAYFEEEEEDNRRRWGSRWNKIDTDNLPEGEVLCKNIRGMILYGRPGYCVVLETNTCAGANSSFMSDVICYFDPDDLEECDP